MRKKKETELEILTGDIDGLDKEVSLLSICLDMKYTYDWIGYARVVYATIALCAMGCWFNTQMKGICTVSGVCCCCCSLPCQ